MKLKRITPEEIAEYGVVNAPDKLVGNPHDNKMIFDRLIREVVAGAINALIDQWEEMDEAEDQRDEAEEQREAAEQARQEAENLRQNTFREEIEEAKGHEEGAYRAMNLAAENAHWSEAFAVGQENGVDIDSTNPAYRNNAKFYAEQARNVVGGDDVFVCPNILVSAADWSASTKYDDFPWEATAQVKDINGQHVPFVVFDHVDAATYGLATVADTADERLTIYSVTMPERDILIPATVFMSEGAIQSAWKALSGGKEGEVLAKQSGKDHDFKWMPISGLGAGLDGERGLAIYRANKPWSEWTSEYFDFDDFILPAEYKPKPNDLVLTSNNYLCWIYSVNENAREAVVASFMPAVSLNGGPGPAGDPGESPNISILPGERDEEDGTVRYGTVIEVTNPDGSEFYAFVPDGRDGDPGPAGANGKDGEDGKDGDTPYIGANGNWWIGDKDTGVSAGGGGSGGGGLVVVCDTGDGTANYSVSEIEVFVSRGIRVVYRRYNSAEDENNFVEYALTVLNAPSKLARFSYDDAGSSEGYNTIIHHEVYLFDRTIRKSTKANKFPKKVSDLENDVPFVAAPATAAVGQAIVVSEVDAEGKPTKWEAADASVDLDTTLSVAGMAADAKAVGDALVKISGGVVPGRFFGKVANFLGDSQTDDAGNYKSVFFYDWLKDILGLSATNSYGYSGTTIMPIAGQNRSFLERYSSMSNDADLIVVWGGTNDYHYGHALGGFDDTVNTTFCGALNNLCKGLITKYPQKDILFVTPTPRGNVAGAVATQGEYADAIISVCAKYCIPVFDAFRKCNMPIVVDSGRKYTVDGLHLNDLGHEILGKSMANFILYSEMAGCRAAWGVPESGGEDDPDSGETEATLTGISATYSGGDVPVGTALTALTGIVVTATYSDGSTKTVTGYSLSGSIGVGSNTIVVSYGGLTTTFVVTGIEEVTAPASPVDGKTVTYAAQASYPKCSNFVLLVDANDFGNSLNDEFVFTMKYSNATQALSGFARGMTAFSDETGEVGNGAYKVSGLSGYISSAVSNGVVTATFKRNDAANDYPYVKVSVPIAMGGYPVSFDVESVTMTRNGEYIEILKVGGFYTNEGFTSGESGGSDSGGDSGGDQTTKLDSPVDGKAVTFTSACVHTANQSNLIALVNTTDLPDTDGEVILCAEIENPTQGISGVSRGMSTYQDETGEVNNNAFKTPLIVGYMAVTNDNNTLTSTGTYDADSVQYPYAKFPLTFQPAAYPVSFNVKSLTLSVGGKNIPIQKVGAFTANEGFSVSG